MPWFVTIGYGDAAGYERTDQSVLDAAHASDERLQARGAIMGIAGAPLQVRNHDGRGVETTPGAYMTSALPPAGFALIEAADVEEAGRLVAGSPCAVAQGVIEVWPLETR
jgi:hypothetical protein